VAFAKPEIYETAGVMQDEEVGCHGSNWVYSGGIQDA
jgi:hypothetical protein